MKNLLHKNQLFYTYMSLVILLSSWTIYYTLPYANVFFLISTFLIFLWHDFSFDKSKIIFSCLFGIILFRNFLPLDISIYDRQFYYSFIQMLFLISILLVSKNNLYGIYQKFIKILTLIVGVGLIFHVFHIVGYPLLSSFTTHESAAYRLFAVYLTHSNLIIHGVEGIFRYSSIFDEPGYLGTILAFILCIEKYNLKIHTNKILFIAGVMTMSGSFFLLTLIYFLLHGLYFSKIRYYLKTIVFASLMVSLMYVFFPEIFELITSRFNISPGEGFEDSRLNYYRFTQYVNWLSALDTNLLLWGTNRFAEPSDFGIYLGHVSWVHLVIRIGLILFIYMIFLLILFSFRTHNYYVFIFVAIFLISTNYRPQIFNPIYIFLLTYALFQVNDLKSKSNESPAQ
jgi:hypothetical protein